MWDHAWGRLGPNLDVAKKTDARVSGGLVELVCAVLLNDVCELTFFFSLEKMCERGGRSSGTKNVP